jgi:hypothetical protein
MSLPLGHLMTHDHTFIDAAGSDTVIALGHSVCPTEPELDGPPLWAANVRDRRVSVWRVYEDTPENKALFGLDRA